VRKGGNQRIIAHTAALAHAAAAHARRQMGNQRIIAAVAAAAVAPGRIKAHARRQMMTRVLWWGMLPWINAR
jgi:uncharacterized membrane protein YebE (DUF533 family)